MKNSIIVTLLIASSISLGLHAGPLVLENRHKNTIEYKANISQYAPIESHYETKGSLEPNKQVLVSSNIYTMRSLEINNKGLYSSLNDYLRQIQNEQNDPANKNKYSLLIISPEESSMSTFSKVTWSWIDLLEKQQPTPQRPQQPLPQQQYKLDIAKTSSTFSAVSVCNKTNQELIIKSETVDGILNPIPINPNNTIELFRIPDRRYVEATVTNKNNSLNINILQAIQFCLTNSKLDGEQKFIYTITINYK